MKLDSAQRTAIAERVRDALALIPNIPVHKSTPFHGHYEDADFNGFCVDWIEDGSLGRFDVNENGKIFVSTCTQENTLYNRLGLKAKIETIFENVMRKHKDLQFLCDSFEAARPHIPFKLQSHIVEDADGKPSLIVHRVNSRISVTSGEVEVPVLLCVVSVKFDGHLHLWCCASDMKEQESFDVFAKQMCFPENYAPEFSAK